MSARSNAEEEFRIVDTILKTKPKNLTMMHVPTLLKVLKEKKENVESQGNALGVLCDLCAKSVDNREKVIKLGGIQISLDAMKRYPSDDLIQKSGCAALQNLAFGDGRITIAKMGGIKVILDAIKRRKSNANMVKKGLGALNNLIANVENKKTLTKLDGIRLTLDMLKRHTSDAFLVWVTSAMIMKFADGNTENQKTIARMDDKVF